MLVLVGRGPVTMFGVIVADILVHVQRGRQRRRSDESMCEHDSQEAAHGDSVLRSKDTLPRSQLSECCRTQQHGDHAFDRETERELCQSPGSIRLNMG